MHPQWACQLKICGFKRFFARPQAVKKATKKAPSKRTMLSEKLSVFNS